MNWDCIISKEEMLSNFSYVIELVKNYGSVIIVDDGGKKYMLTEFQPEERKLPPRMMDERMLKTLLRRIGIEVFVRYYSSFQNYDDPLAIMAGESFTDASKRSRCSTAHRIFKNGWERSALQIAADSKNISLEARMRAKELLDQTEKEETV